MAARELRCDRGEERRKHSSWARRRATPDRYVTALHCGCHQAREDAEHQQRQETWEQQRAVMQQPAMRMVYRSRLQQLACICMC